MLPRSPEEKLKELDRKMVRVGIIDTPGFIALGLGLYAKFGAEPGDLHPILENPTVSSGLLIGGAAIAAWGALQMVSIARQRSEIERDLP